MPVGWTSESVHGLPAAPGGYAADHGYMVPAPQASAGMPPTMGTWCPEAWPAGPPGMEGGVPLAYTAGGPWLPPGIIPPWPSDEYLRDGGNAGPAVRVGSNGELLGLEMEDTVARYSTLDGRTLVEPSNKVNLYSPRFGAVRQVVDVEVEQQRNRAAGVAEPVKPLGPRTSEPVGLNTQNLQAVRDIGTNPALQLRSRQSHATLFAELRPKAFDNFYRVYENLAVIRTGVYVGHEEAILARARSRPLPGSTSRPCRSIWITRPPGPRWSARCRKRPLRSARGPPIRGCG